MNLPASWSSLRSLVLLIASIETVLVALIVGYLLTSGSSEEVKSINRIVASLLATVHAVSGTPALALALWGRWLCVALVFTIVPVPLAALRLALY